MICPETDTCRERYAWNTIAEMCLVDYDGAKPLRDRYSYRSTGVVNSNEIFLGHSQVGHEMRQAYTRCIRLPADRCDSVTHRPLNEHKWLSRKPTPGLYVTC